MEEFIKWFLENWNANIFTLFTVLLSGIISLIISAAYYRKGNRNNLKMSVIHPIISILNDSYSTINEQVRDFAYKKGTLNSIVLYNESDKTNICNIYERRCLLQILYIIPHSYTTSLRN